MSKEKMIMVQWNINGFHLHLPELQQIAAEQHPKVKCLQDTYLNNTEQVNLKGYTIFPKYRPNDRHGCGEVALLILNNNHAKIINMYTNLEAIVLKIYKPAEINKCKVYIPHHHINYSTRN